MSNYSQVLFDLDGTLLDSAPDFAVIVRLLRDQAGLPPLPYEPIRASVSHGTQAVIDTGFQDADTLKDDPAFFNRFLDLYEEHLATASQLFAGMDAVLSEFEKAGIPWGIVTNKPTRFTLPLLERLRLDQRAQVVVCGDTFPNRKPHPQPLVEAMRALRAAPDRTLYCGDAERDIQAGHRAGMPTALAAYGYLGESDTPCDWRAHHWLHQPSDLIPLVFDD